MDAAAFVDLYYHYFTTNRDQLAPLYRDESTLTFEDTLHLGVKNIMKKLSGLPFKIAAYQISSTDAQPTMENCLKVLVTGSLSVDGDPPVAFTQTFTLVPSGTPSQSLFILNDIFRLVY